MSEFFDTTWTAQRRWSGGADALKKSLDRWGLIVLAMALLGAALETISAQPGILGLTEGPAKVFTRSVALAGAGVLGLIPVFSTYRLGRERRRAWVSARMIAEGLKREAFLYQAGVEKYRDPQKRDEALVGARRSLLESEAELLRFVRLPDPDGKLPPPELDAEAYIEHRLESQALGQVTYFEGAAARHDRLAARYRTAQFVLAAIAALLGAASAVFSEAHVGPWVAVVTTASTAVAAHLATNRHEALYLKYAAAAAELRRRVEEFRLEVQNAAPTAEQTDKLVRDCEAILAAEQGDWAAILQKAQA